MAELSDFRRNLTKARETGEWVRVGDEYGDLEILTRGLTDEYTDMRNAAFRRIAVQRYRGDIARITTAETREVNVDCLAAKCLIDVRNLANKGEPVTLPQFIVMLRDPDYGDLLSAAFQACNNVGRARDADAEDDVKN